MEQVDFASQIKLNSLCRPMNWLDYLYEIIYVFSFSQMTYHLIVVDNIQIIFVNYIQDSPLKDRRV